MTIARPWFEDLEDSVRALGEAAREYQLAYTAATTLQAGVEFERRQLHAGKVAGAHAKEATGWAKVPTTREPHKDAVFQLRDLYDDHTFRVKDLYEQAALLYASGCAWAIQAVQQGHNPNGVLFELGNDRRLLPGTYEIKGLERLVDHDKREAAYRQLMTCLQARTQVEDIDGYEAAHGYEALADHEAALRQDAVGVAARTADAAYAYGRLAEPAVRFVLFEPRQENYRREAEDKPQT